MKIRVSSYPMAADHAAATPCVRAFVCCRLESENARLKKLLADAMLDNAALKDLLAKKW
jgi:putative transposase